MTTATRLGHALVLVLAAVAGAGGAPAAYADGPCDVFALDQPKVLKKDKSGGTTEQPFDDRYHQIVARVLKGKELIRYFGIDDLQVKIDTFKIDHPGCTCISTLHLYAHGSESVLNAGCSNRRGSLHKCTNAAENQNYYFAGGGVGGANRNAWSELFRRLNPTGAVYFKMCANGTIRLIGCNTGRCNHAGPFLHDVAKLAGVRTFAPAVYVKASEALAILAKPDVWQSGDPTAAAPQQCKSPSQQRIPRRGRRAELLPHCPCNGTTYDDASSCTGDCQVTLACFTGICSPVWVNETWDGYEGNPVLTGSAAAVTGAAVRATPATANAPMTSASDWYRSGVSQPTVLRDGGTHRMWFAGWNDDDGGKSRIGYATSTDGLAWTVYPDPVLDAGAPGAFDDGEVAGPSVLRDGGVYHMWYSGFSDRDRIGHATSVDGVHWAKDASPALDVGPESAWDSRLVSGPAVLKDGNVFMMWYKGRSEDLWDRFGLATSPDGIHWTRAAANPVLREGDAGAWDEYGIDAPTVVRNGGGFHMFYAGMNGDDWDEYDWSGYRRIGYARSADGIAWDKSATNPQLGPSPAFVDHDDTWDSQGVYHPAALWDPNEAVFELYARGRSLDEAFAIGTFTTDDPGASPSPPTTTTTTIPGTPPACTSGLECDDGDPCTADDCVAGRCVATLFGGYGGVSCELERLALLRSCDPDAGRRLVRKVRRETRAMQRKLVKLEQTTRARRRRSLAKQVLRGLGRLEQSLEEARRGGKLNDGCAQHFLQVLTAAHTGMEQSSVSPRAASTF